MHVLIPSLVLAVGAVALAVATPPTQGTAATYISAEDVAATIAAAPDGRVSDQQIRHIDAGDLRLGIGVVSRPSTTTMSAIQHHKQAEVYRVVSGYGTLVTSRTMGNARALDPEGRTVLELTGPSSFGTIEGGMSQKIGPGDFVIIPAGVAHGFSEITEPITYVVIRIDPDQLVKLK